MVAAVGAQSRPGAAGGQRAVGCLGVPVHQIRAPGERSGASFTHRDSPTLPLIWAGPVTSTERGFFQGCLAANCWVDWQAAQMKEKTRQNAPLSRSPLRRWAGLGWSPADLGPSPAPAPPGFLCPPPPEARGATRPLLLAPGPGTRATDPRPPPHPTPLCSCSSLPAGAGAGFRGAGLHEAEYCKALLRVSCPARPVAAFQPGLLPGVGTVRESCLRFRHSPLPPGGHPLFQERRPASALHAEPSFTWLLWVFV